MSITALHVPQSAQGYRPMTAVQVDERDVRSYHYVHGGPAEPGYVSIEGMELVIYVNARYTDLPDLVINYRASSLFRLGEAPVAGGFVRGDALVVLAPGGTDYERSLPPETIAMFLDAER